MWPPLERGLGRRRAARCRTDPAHRAPRALLGCRDRRRPDPGGEVAGVPGRMRGALFPLDAARGRRSGRDLSFASDPKGSQAPLSGDFWLAREMATPAGLEPATRRLLLQGACSLQLSYGAKASGRIQVVIASEAKQSSNRRAAALDCFVPPGLSRGTLLAMTAAVNRIML